MQVEESLHLQNKVILQQRQMLDDQSHMHMSIKEKEANSGFVETDPEEWDNQGLDTASTQPVHSSPVSLPAEGAP